MSNIHHLFSQTSVIGHFVRIGHTSYRALEDLYTAKRVPISHAVFDANHIERQKDLAHTLYDGNVEIILDLKSAELATNSGLESSAKHLPWANSDRPHWINDWNGKNGKERATQIAEFAVKNDIDCVLSPSHIIESFDSSWINTDIQMVHLLRDALNRSGGRHIRIDYHLTLSVSLLRNYELINYFGERLANSPVGNIWLRVSNYGMSGSPTGTKKYIEAAWRLQAHGNPLVADTTGGIAGISLASFGAIGGICHGIAEKEKFCSSGWNSVYRNGHGGGSKPRIYLPELDLFLQKDKAKHFLGGRGAKSLALCKDPNCCHDLNEMLTSPKAHALRQAYKQIEQLNEQPELKRVDYLLGELLTKLGRTLRKASNIKLDDPAITKKFKEHSRRTDLLHSTLENLYSESESIPISKTPMDKTRPMKKAG